MKRNFSQKELVQMMESYDGSGSNRATVISAVSFPKEEKEAVSKILTQHFGEGLSISFDTNPDILGGLRVEVGDWVYDGTLSRELKELVNTLTT